MTIKATPSNTTIFEWYKEFSYGRSTFDDEFREGRPKIAVTEKDILAA